MARKIDNHLFFIVTAIVLSVILVNVNGSSSVINDKPEAPSIPANSRQSITVTHNPLKCDCEISKDDKQICANNGITYANQCKFDCAKQKVKRLRQVKDGPCKGVTLEEYWKKP